MTKCQTCIYKVCAKAEREALQAKVEELEVQQHGWVKESAPGGWIYALRLRCEAAELDAKRYRWLRENGTGGSNRHVWVGTPTGPCIAGHEYLDAAIDAATKGETP